MMDTLLKEHDQQSDLEINGFDEALPRDRDPSVTGKLLGGGLCLYGNKNWCSTAEVREKLCTVAFTCLHTSILFTKGVQTDFITLIDIATWTKVDTAQRLQSIVRT